MDEMTVRHQGGDRFEIDVRGHRVIVDQPSGAGGSDKGPTPTELFVAGLASCVASTWNGSSDGTLCRSRGSR